MSYIPHTDQDRLQMMQTIGINKIEELFQDIPENLRLKEDLNIPSKQSEPQLWQHLYQLAQQNKNASQMDWFLGAGIYNRYIPSIVGAVISRGEFLTAYTPYQPELSQGSLQTIYEFQTMVANLYGMDVANASMYDASTALAEAALMARLITQKRKVVVSQAVHPHYRQVLKTYCWACGLEYCELNLSEGITNLPNSLLDADSACLIIQSPNFFGIIEEQKVARQLSESVGALLIVVSDPTSVGLLTPPGEFGADIVVGEGQPLGIPMGFGGPLLGLLCCKKEYIRQIPGRIVGRTQDGQGRTGYTMTLRTREQDIRREKASSNICTNQALMALAATVYMSALGKNGLRSIAESTVQNTQYAIQSLVSPILKTKLKYQQRVFGEFVLELPKGNNAKDVQSKLLEKNIMSGLPLGDYYPDHENCLLVTLTELNSKTQIDYYAEALQEVLN
jgi:glycine dehydrogenase subunit 1